MSKHVTYRCEACDHAFEREEHDGLFPRILPCETCEKAARVAMTPEESAIRDDAALAAHVERNAPLCECGGQLRLGLSARCPKCGSEDCERT